MKYIICILSLVVFVGCTSSNDMYEMCNEMRLYMDYNGNKLLEYINNDNTLLERDRESYRSRHRYILNLLNKYE